VSCVYRALARLRSHFLAVGPRHRGEKEKTGISHADIKGASYIVKIAEKDELLQRPDVVSQYEEPLRVEVDLVHVYVPRWDIFIAIGQPRVLFYRVCRNFSSESIIDELLVASMDQNRVRCSALFLSFSL
jgi:hypothetical protein